MRRFWIQCFDFLPAYKIEAFRLAQQGNLLERRFW
jgi:hypothetical protein